MSKKVQNDLFTRKIITAPKVATCTHIHLYASFFFLFFSLSFFSSFLGRGSSTRLWKNYRKKLFATKFHSCSAAEAIFGEIHSSFCTFFGEFSCWVPCRQFSPSVHHCAQFTGEQAYTLHLFRQCAVTADRLWLILHRGVNLLDGHEFRICENPVDICLFVTDPMYVILYVITQFNQPVKP